MRHAMRGMAPHRKAGRIEHDTLGEIEVPGERRWGAQTERSLEHFRIGTQRLPAEFIRSYAVIKWAAARANAELRALDAAKARAIMAAALEIYEGPWEGQWNREFPLVPFQTGSGTHTNMNLNEVIAHRASELLEREGSQAFVHPNDDVNRSQSTNDTFSAAMHVAAIEAMTARFLPAARKLIETLIAKEREFAGIKKLGRTHLQDAVSLSLGQEVSGWRSQLEHAVSRLKVEMMPIFELPLGATAVGTGLNAPTGFARAAFNALNDLTGRTFRPASNPFEALASHDALAALSGGLRATAGALFKIAADVRLLASGPDAGLGEIHLPVEEPGSSIMPAKANPTQAEALQMVAVQVYGLDAAVAFAASQGSLELNTFKPLIIFDVLEEVRLLADGCASFEEHCARGLEANRERIKRNLEASPMSATALVPAFGYEKVAEIIQVAETQHIPVAQAIRLTGAGMPSGEALSRWEGEGGPPEPDEP